MVQTCTWKGNDTQENVEVIELIFIVCKFNISAEGTDVFLRFSMLCCFADGGLTMGWTPVQMCENS